MLFLDPPVLTHQSVLNLTWYLDYSDGYPSTRRGFRAMRNGGCSLQVMMEQMLYREKDGVLYLKAVGPITAAICPSLKRLVSDRLSLIKKLLALPLIFPNARTWIPRSSDSS
jgi:hypothetical protein